jgi:hypothetical protein
MDIVITIANGGITKPKWDQLEHNVYVTSARGRIGNEMRYMLVVSVGVLHNRIVM